MELQSNTPKELQLELGSKSLTAHPDLIVLGFLIDKGIVSKKDFLDYVDQFTNGKVGD